MLTALRTRQLQLEPWQRTLAVMFIAQVCTAIGFSIIFPFLPLYVEDLGTNTGLSIEFWAGMVFSAQAFTMMIASPIWGSLADRYGRKLMVERAAFGGTIVIFLMAFVTSAEQLVFIRMIQGMITGTVSAANALVAASAPRNKMGFAMATIQMALWTGVALGPLIGGVLSDAFGYRIPFVITAGLLFVAGLMVHFLVHEEFEPQAKQQEEKRGFIGDIRHIMAMNGVPQAYGIRFLTGLSRSMIIPIMPLFVAYLLAGGALRIPNPEMFADVGIAAGLVGTFTGMVIGISSATSTFSGVYFGRLGDRIGHRSILIGASLAATVVYLPQAFVTNPWQLIALQGITGLVYGGLVAAPSALLAQYTDPGEEGAVYGLDNSVVAAARAVAPLIGAGVAFVFGLRAVMLMMSGLFLLIAVVSVIMLPRMDVAAFQAKHAPKPEPAPTPTRERELQPSGAD